MRYERPFLVTLLLTVFFFLPIENCQAVRIISRPLAEIVKRADLICLGELLDAKTTLNSYEYGLGSRSWDETAMTFSVKKVLKGSWSGKTGSGTYTLPSFADYNDPKAKEQECPVIDGSGIEESLRKGDSCIFLLETASGARTLLRVEAATMLDTVRKMLP